MTKLPLSIGTIHFIGIGGIGMSGIAEVLHGLDYKVQGSDIAESYNVARLRKLGIPVSIGHSKENIYTAQNLPVSAVVYSSAVKANNPEVVMARELGIPVIQRADMLAELMRLKWSIAIAGTHGKTTTTSMVGHILEGADLDPTVINGGIINAYGTNTRMGAGEWLVAETDESDGTFTKLPFVACVVTNIDPEHMDHYGDFNAVKEAYRTFVHNLPFYGFAAMCIDHPVVAELIPTLARKVIPYGFSEAAHVRALNIESTDTGSKYDVAFGKDLLLKDVRLPMYGRHNILNSLAVFIVGHELGISLETIKASLSGFQGVKRRFTQTGVSKSGVTVIDDYGHHPVEIEAVLKAAREAVTARAKGGRVIAVVQPHRYTRLSSLFDQFAKCLDLAEIVVVADVYAAGEEPIAGADKEHLIAALKKNGRQDVYPLGQPAELASLIHQTAKPGDFVICLGAGSITQWANTLPKELDILNANAPRAANENT